VATVTGAAAVPNLRRLTGFAMGEGAIERACATESLPAIGVYHTHRHACSPSGGDLVGMRGSPYPIWLILHATRSADARAFLGSASAVAELEVTGLDAHAV
jgi:proteasome lid subunit RPN8/RPN11